MKLIYGVNNLSDIKKEENRLYYFGFDFKNKKRLIDAGYIVIDTRELISESAHEIKFDFIDYITEVGKNQKSELRWWAAKIASKSNLQTDFFDIVCLLKAIDTVFKNEPNLTAVTDDLRIFLLLKDNFKTRIKTVTKVKYKLELFFKVLIPVVLSIPKRFYFIFNRIYTNFKTKKYFTQNTKQKIFLYSWVEERSFDAVTGSYNDPYFPNIDDYLEESDDLVRFCSYFVKPKLLKSLKDKANLDGLSNYASTFKILKSGFYFFKPKEIKPFKSFNLKRLWFFEILSENTDVSFISHIQDYYAWKNFFTTNRGKLIYPFENQPWEKMMILANSKMKLTGVLHTTIHNLLLPFHTTERELKYMPVPEELITNAVDTQSLYEKYFTKSEVKITNAGSLRFTNNKIELYRDNTRPTVGIMLSCIKSQTEEQLADVINGANPNYNYLIKTHPDLKREVTETNNISLFKGNATDLYKNVNAIVYCSSTSGIEAFSMGIPVFRLRTQYMDLETAENSFSPKIINSIKEISKDQLIFHKPKEMFSRVKKTIWQEILNSSNK